MSEDNITSLVELKEKRKTRQYLHYRQLLDELFMDATNNPGDADTFIEAMTDQVGKHIGTTSQSPQQLEMAKQDAVRRITTRAQATYLALWKR